MNTYAWLSLGATVTCIALALVVEHHLTGHRGWARRLYYAEGLLTVLVGLAAWLAVHAITVTLPVALLLILAGCLSGGPDFLLLWREERLAEQRRRDEAERWVALESMNAELAARLLRLKTTHVNSRHWQHLREMTETAAFAVAAMRQERAAIELAEQEQKRILEQLQVLIGGPLD